MWKVWLRTVETTLELNFCSFDCTVCYWFTCRRNVVHCHTHGVMKSLLAHPFHRYIKSHFRIHFSLYFKAKLRAKSLSWKSVFIDMALLSLRNWGELGNGLLRSGARFSKVPKAFLARKTFHKTPTRKFWKAGLLICCKVKCKVK